MSPHVPNPALLPPGVAGPPAPAPVRSGVADAPVQGPSFAELPQRRTVGVEFSRHALQRLERRGIELSEATLARLTEGVDRAAGKGSRESVVFVDGTAFVVSIRNRTVITAVDPEHMREHVFTNIDSAVIA